MSYHMIIEVPVNVDGAEFYVKVELQIRSMAMDFWATLEHELQYKGSGKKKNATAIAFCRKGKGTLRVNGVPIDLLEPEIMKNKVMEPILLLGYDKLVAVSATFGASLVG